MANFWKLDWQSRPKADGRPKQMLHGRIPGSRRSCCFAAKTGRTDSDADQPDLQQMVASGSGQKSHFWRTWKRLNYFQSLPFTFSILGLNIWLVCEVTYAIIERPIWKILLTRS